MATENEKAKVRELIELAIGVNDAGLVTAQIDVSHLSVQVRLSAKPFNAANDWVYYPDRPAYFSDDSFTEESFIYVADGYIAELKKHHPQYDADGVRV